MNNLPKAYTFDELSVGQKDSFTKMISESLLNEFANISGDFNPIHMDENYASSSLFKKRICHGMLLASFFSQLVGMYLPGENSLYFSQELNFRKPCFIGDKITVEGKIIEKSESTRIVSISTSIFNQSGECLIDGIAKVLLRTN